MYAAPLCSMPGVCDGEALLQDGKMVRGAAEIPEEFSPEEFLSRICRICRICSAAPQKNSSGISAAPCTIFPSCKGAAARLRLRRGGQWSCTAVVLSHTPLHWASSMASAVYGTSVA
jgi:hypothetical protein